MNILHGLLDEGYRKNKPRKTGLTMVIDHSLGPSQMEDYLSIASNCVDFIKLAYGTTCASMAVALKRKLEIGKQHGIKICPGGSLFEALYWSGNLEPYLERIASSGFTAVEISDGIQPITRKDRDDAIKKAKALGLTVLLEIGRKDPKAQLSQEETISQVKWGLNGLADYIVIEARAAGKVGIFDKSGEVRESFLSNILNQFNSSDLGKIIWEAPKSDQQAYLINRLGQNVNLGNIVPSELLGLEAMRMGLRWDTSAIREKDSLVKMEYLNESS